MSETRTTILSSITDCVVGMKVRHVMHTGRSKGAGSGEIVKIEDDGVHVHFVNGLRGIYDIAWFRHSDVHLELEE